MNFVATIPAEIRMQRPDHRRRRARGSSSSDLCQDPKRSTGCALKSIATIAEACLEIEVFTRTLNLKLKLKVIGWLGTNFRGESIVD